MIHVQPTGRACLALCLALCGLVSISLSAHSQGEKQPGAQNATVDLSTPQRTIQTFVAAIKKGDMTAAAKCVVNGKPTPLPGPVGVHGPDIILSDVIYKTEGARATFTGKSAIVLPGSPQGYPIEEKLELNKKGGAWYLVAPAKNTRGYLTQFVLMFGHPELLKEAHVKALEEGCLSNLRQIGTACLMFLQDYQETFSFKAQNVKSALMPYLKNEQAFRCPLDNSGSVSYAFNSRLAGLHLPQISKPAETVMVYEGKDGTLLFRHDGKAGVVFVDGHAKLVTADQAKSLRWKP